MDQEVLERNVARKTVIPEIEESEKPVLPVDIYTQISDPEVARMVNQVTNRILGLGEEGESGSVQ